MIGIAVQSYISSLESSSKSISVERIRELSQRLAKLDTWTLQCFLDELNEGLSDWAAHLPGMGQLARKKGVDHTKKVLGAIVTQQVEAQHQLI